MRVTDLTKHSTVKKNLQRTSSDLQNLMVGISSGKVLNKPSDDPLGAAKVQDFHTSIDRSKSLERNISADKVWLNAMELNIEQLGEAFKKVKEVAIQGANGSQTIESRQTMAHEIDAILNDVTNLGNAKEGKLYLFSGTKTFTPPFERQPSITEPEIYFYDLKLHSTTTTIPLDQKKPIPELQPGTFTLSIKNQSDGAETPPTDLTVHLNGTESLREVVNKINEAAVAEQGYQNDDYFPTGFKARIFADIGVDQKTHIEPEMGASIKFGSDTTGFLKLMNFQTSDGSPVSSKTDESVSQGPSPIRLDNAQFEAQFKGYSKENYTVRIIQSGTYGNAKYIVSDNDGKSWSKPQFLNRENEIFNPDGKASNKVQLSFRAPEAPWFQEGTEIKFKGNEFMAYKGNEQKKQVLLDNGIKVALNITGNELFFEDEADEDSINMFDVLNRLSEALKDDDQLSVTKSIGDVDKCINQILDKRGLVGSIVRELESSEERIESNIDFKSTEKSKIEDMDITKGATDLNAAELKHKVALDSTARLIQPTLINFLK